MNNLLINEYPLMVLPGLAKKIGLNEAIILQQVHYWLKTSAKKYDGKTWTYNTYQDWQKQFPFWSERTIRRTIKNLEEDGYLISGNYNKVAYDKTKWYTIDYAKLKGETVTNADLSSCGQNGQTMRTDCPEGDWPDCPDGLDKMARPIPETSSKTSSKTSSNNKDIGSSEEPPSSSKKEKKKSILSEEQQAMFEEFINHLNKEAKKRFTYKNKDYQKLFKARLTDGYGLKDFIYVIDVKTEEWLNDSKMNTHLNPGTLLKEKYFENYLNQPMKKKKNVNDPNDFGAEALEQNFNNDNNWGF